MTTTEDHVFYVQRGRAAAKWRDIKNITKADPIRVSFVTVPPHHLVFVRKVEREDANSKHRQVHRSAYIAGYNRIIRYRKKG